MVRSRSEALAVAMAATTNVPGTCQATVHGWFDAPAVGDVDGDKDADAVDGWLSEPIAARHNGDRNPPEGAPLAFSGGSRGFGHRCISRGGHDARSTDMNNGSYQAGTVGNATIEQIEQHMGVTYLGWSETIDGLPIPADTGDTVTTTFGIDVSHFQSGLTLDSAKHQGYEFVSIKCTQGTTFVDPNYTNAVAAAEKAGLLARAYHFLEKGNGAAQAQFLAKHIGDKSLPVSIDVELNPATGGRPTAQDWIDFHHEAERLGLNVVDKYLNENYWVSIGRPNLKGPLRLWVASYPSSAHDYGSRLYPGNTSDRWHAFGNQEPTIWQFASSVKIDGYGGNVDGNAFRGSRSDLVKLGLFKDFAPTDPKPTPPPPPPTPTPPAPTPPPTPTPPAPSGGSKDFVVHLVPGNKKETADNVKYDMGLVKKHTNGGSAVVFNTERESAALLQAVSDGLGAGWTRAFDNECTLAYGSNWSQTANPLPYLLAKADPGMAGVSPNRWLNMIPLENKLLPGVTLKFKGTHFVSEANCVHVHVLGRAWREKTYKIQLNDTLKAVAHDHDNDQPVVFAGDLNTGVYFTGDQLFAEFVKRFGAENCTHVYNGGLDHIILVSSKSVALSEVGKEIITDNKSDHNMVSATIRATKR